MKSKILALSLASLSLLSFGPAFGNEANDQYAPDDAVTAEEPTNYSEEVERHDNPWEFPRRQGWICYARNFRGQFFTARGWNRWQAQNQALRLCQWQSRFGCRPVGCRPLRW